MSSYDSSPLKIRKYLYIPHVYEHNYESVVPAWILALVAHTDIISIDIPILRLDSDIYVCFRY